MVIFLDKLHPADKKGLGKATRFIDQHVGNDLKYCKIQMIPERTNPKIENFPFSYEFVLQCFLSKMRSKSEQSYKSTTLDFENMPSVLAIVFLFLKLNRGMTFNKKFCDEWGLDGFLPL